MKLTKNGQEHARQKKVMVNWENNQFITLVWHLALRQLLEDHTQISINKYIYVVCSGIFNTPIFSQSSFCTVSLREKPCRRKIWEALAAVPDVTFDCSQLTWTAPIHRIIVCKGKPRPMIVRIRLALRKPDIFAIKQRAHAQFNRLQSTTLSP